MPQITPMGLDEWRKIYPGGTFSQYLAYVNSVLYPKETGTIVPTAQSNSTIQQPATLQKQGIKMNTFEEFLRLNGMKSTDPGALSGYLNYITQFINAGATRADPLVKVPEPIRSIPTTPNKPVKLPSALTQRGTAALSIAERKRLAKAGRW